jgi:hypothetical protein
MQIIIESLRFWIPFIFISWLFGYFSTKFKSGAQYLRIPIWFYYFCGYPKIIGYPRGILTRQGAGMQIVSFFLLVFAICFDRFFPDRNTSGLVGIFSSLIGSFMVIQILLRRSSYSDQ